MLTIVSIGFTLIVTFLTLKVSISVINMYFHSGRFKINKECLPNFEEEIYWEIFTSRYRRDGRIILRGTLGN
jgi:hypothetical protein